MLDGGFRSLFDECPTTTLAEFDVTCLQHEDAKTRVRVGNVKVNIALTSAKASSIDTVLIPATRLHRRFLMTPSVKSLTSV